MLQTIRTYMTEVEAHLDLTFLESHQITAYLFNSNSSTIYPIFNGTIGGIELKVNEVDFSKALSLLSSIEE